MAGLMVTLGDAARVGTAPTPAGQALASLMRGTLGAALLTVARVTEGGNHPIQAILCWSAPPTVDSHSHTLGDLPLYTYILGTLPVPHP